MKYFVIQPDGKVEEFIQEKEPDLETLQRLVGGMIEAVTIKYRGKQTLAYINEEGKLNDLSQNRMATALWHNNFPSLSVKPITDVHQDPAGCLSPFADQIVGPMIVMTGI